MFFTIKNIFIFKNEYYFGYLDFIVYTLITLVPLLIAIAFFTLAERKAMAAIQRRKGPNVVGISKLYQANKNIRIVNVTYCYFCSEN